MADKTIYMAQAQRILELETEYKRLEKSDEALRESVEKYFRIFNSSAVALWEMDFSAVREYIEKLKNRKIKNIQEYLTSSPNSYYELESRIKLLNVNETTLSLLKANSMEELYSSFENLLTDNSRLSFLKCVMALDAGKHVYNDEVCLKRIDGKEIFVYLTAKILPDARKNWDWVLLTIQDITERKQAAEELRKSEERFRILSQSAFEGLVVHNKGYIINANEQFYEMFGYVPEELHGINAIELTVTSGSIEVMKEKIYSEDLGPYEITGIKKDGTQFPVEIRARLIEYHGQMARISAIRDLSERKAAEKEKKELESRLRQVQKMEAIGNLAGGIAHDFNNILFPIVGLSEMLLEDLSPESPERESVEEIFKAAKRGGELVQQILTFSRKSEHKMVPTRIQNILKEVLKLSRATIPTYIEINHDIQQDCGMIMADSTQIHQIVMNIITNAYHALEDKSGKLTIRLKQVELRDSDLSETNLRAGQYAVLSVSDTGKGMSNEQIDKIFEPYFTTKEQGRGTGLGLAVVYGIVKEHKGDIKVYSETGKGSTFTVYLPLVEKTESFESIDSVEEYTKGNERILLVDDEAPIVKIEKMMLERIGYKVTSRQRSIEALDVFKAHPYSFDLVVTDMNMPNIPGDRLAEKIKSIRFDIPIIICTGYNDRICIDNIQRMNIDGILMKPVLLSELAGLVRKVLDGAKGKTQTP